MKAFACRVGRRTPRPAMAAGIQRLRETLPDRIAGGHVVHPGDVRLPLAPGVSALPYADP